MKHSVRSLAALVVFGTVAETAFGVTRYVSRSGDYEAPSIWQNGEMPSEDGTDAASIGAIWSAEVGKMKFAPSADWTQPSTLTVARPGSVLEFVGSRYTVLTGAPTGADYDIAVSGKLAIADDMTVPFATFKPGATLAFMRKGDGTIPVLTVDGDVDLTGVALTGYSDEEDSAAMRKTVILKVSRGCRIAGVPSETDHFKFAVVANEDGGYSLEATCKQGPLFILR